MGPGEVQFEVWNNVRLRIRNSLFQSKVKLVHNYQLKLAVDVGSGERPLINPWKMESPSPALPEGTYFSFSV
jgi:hypothetical protein